MTDCANWEQLGIIIRYVYQQKPVEKLIEYVKCDKITGKTTASLIIESLKSNGIDISYCRFQTYDGAGNIAGKQMEQLKISKKKILRMIEHYIITVPLTNQTLP